jgi:pSer/pThr/pTyr-binding forkhead associated (FHA) protein
LLELGRRTTSSNPDIAFTNRRVSRRHARLTLNGDRLTLTAGETANATYVGPQRQLLAPGNSVELTAGDSFWLSQEVQLRVERAGGTLVEPMPPRAL